MNRLIPSLSVLLLVFGAACGGGGDSSDAPEAGAAPAPSSSVYAGMPVQQVDVGALDATLAARGQQLFETRCTTCHKLDTRYVGPALGGVVTRREPEYVMNMILAPEKMLQGHPDAQALLAEYGVPMTNQNLTQDEARAILEYLRQVAETAD